MRQEPAKGDEIRDLPMAMRQKPAMGNGIRGRAQGHRTGDSGKVMGLTTSVDADTQASRHIQFQKLSPAQRNVAGKRHSFHGTCQ
jgi:hypothetical protein